MPGADAMLVFKFGDELASTTAEDFVAELLAEQLGAAGVVTGEDFTFGKGRGGNAEVLRELGAEHGIEAETVAPVLLDGERISSGRVREALQAGDPGHRDPPPHPPLRDRGRWSSMATSAAARSAGRPPMSSSAIICAPPTASTRCA